MSQALSSHNAGCGKAEMIAQKQSEQISAGKMHEISGCVLSGHLRMILAYVV